MRAGLPAFGLSSIPRSVSLCPQSRASSLSPSALLPQEVLRPLQPEGGVLISWIGHFLGPRRAVPKFMLPLQQKDACVKPGSDFSQDANGKWRELPLLQIVSGLTNEKHIYDQGCLREQ